MKNLARLSALLFAVLLFACEDEPLQLPDTLHHDGENLTAPLLPAGGHQAAARFTPNDQQPYAGRQLTAVSYFLAGVPADCWVIVQGPGTTSSPGDTLYVARVTPEAKTAAWNEHTLPQPIPITGTEDLWISIGLRHTQSMQSIGCDAGPADPNGDWLFSDSDNQWLTFRQRTGSESINWNIRGKVE